MTVAEKLQKIAENEQKIYEAGRQAEYDAFWDAFQESGNRTNYSLAFSGRAWVDSIFKPKYNINVVGYAEYLFSQTGISDVKGLLEANGVALDTSRAETLAYCFYNSLVTRLPVMDCSGVNRSNGMEGLFKSCSNLVSIDKVIMPDPTPISNYAQFMSACQKLETVVFEGVIGKSKLNMSASTKLSHDSIVSVINALSATTNGLSVTLSKTAVNNAFETSEGVADGSTSEAWLSLVATKSNWTISLV